MAQGKASARDFDALEAEMALALAEPTLPMDKRVEFERRLEAVRLKAAQRPNGASHAHNAGPLRRLG